MTDVEHDEGRVQSPDGVSIYWQRWLPTEPKAILLFIHGLGEHSGRYGHPVEHFTKLGYGCYGLDYRAHGKSPGIRVHVKRFGEFLLDVGAVHQKVKENHPDLPVIPVGHSQGGLIVLMYALKFPDDLPGVIASSPFLGIHPSVRPSAPLKIAAKVLSKVYPSLTLPNNIDPADLSHDPAVAPAYSGDPLTSDKVSARWFTSIIGAHEKALADAPELSVPALVMQSGGDRLVDANATRRWVGAAPAKLVEYVEWDGYFHEMYNETEERRVPVFERMETWLESRLER